MSNEEQLSDSTFYSWLDSAQKTISGEVIVIYDACYSGSFLSNHEYSDKKRVIITSTSEGQKSYFPLDGSLSFSDYFWNHIFHGLNVGDAFKRTRDSIKDITSHDDAEKPGSFQIPLLDVNGNGIYDEEEHLLIQNTYIGNHTTIHGDVPLIDNVPAQTIQNTNAAIISAEGVTDKDGIIHVQAVIKPPFYQERSGIIAGLPSVDLKHIGENRYEGTYDGFSAEGTYQIAIYARDSFGNTSMPAMTTVTVNNPLRNRAIIVAGGEQEHELWSAVENNTRSAYEALTFQGYPANDIYFMSPVTFLDIYQVAASVGNLEHAVKEWSIESTYDVLLYMTGDGDEGNFYITNRDEAPISAATLGKWLDELQNHITGKIIVIYDAHKSESFLDALKPLNEKDRILVFSSDEEDEAYFDADGDISFSRFFWNDVLNGVNLYDAFISAKEQLDYLEKTISPPEDFINRYSIGFGIKIVPTQTLESMPGDINGDSSVNLADAILALKVLAGIADTGMIQNYANSGADVNRDDKVGLEEVIYVIGNVSE